MSNRWGGWFVASILRQHNIGIWWGGFKNVAANVMAYVTFLNLIFVAPVAYTMVVDPWLEERGLSLPFFSFMGILFLGLALIFVLEFKVSIPSIYHFWNEQWWQHKNPMRKEMASQKKRLKGMEKDLGELKSMIMELTKNAKQNSGD